MLLVIFQTLVVDKISIFELKTRGIAWEGTLASIEKIDPEQVLNGYEEIYKYWGEDSDSYRETERGEICQLEFIENDWDGKTIEKEGIWEIKWTANAEYSIYAAKWFQYVWWLWKKWFMGIVVRKQDILLQLWEIERNSIYFQDK